MAPRATLAWPTVGRGLMRQLSPRQLDEVRLGPVLTPQWPTWGSPPPPAKVPPTTLSTPVLKGL